MTLLNVAYRATVFASRGIDPTETTPLTPSNAATLNWLLQSQALATAPWTTNLIATITNNAATAPDGTTTATSVVPNTTSSNQHYVIQTAVPITAGENVAGSFFCKANGYTALVANIDDGTNGFRI